MSDPLSGAGTGDRSDASQFLLRDQFGREIQISSSVVTVMGLCETEALILHPHQLYLFVPMLGCRRCALLAQHAPPAVPAQVSGLASDDDGSAA